MKKRHSRPSLQYRYEHYDPRDVGLIPRDGGPAIPEEPAPAGPPSEEAAGTSGRAAATGRRSESRFAG